MAKNILGKFLKDPPSWRKMAAVAWRPPDDPTIYGTLELDMTNALEYLKTESARSGTKLTVTHLAIKALADTLRKHPDCNAIIRRGRVFVRDDVDVFVQVAIAPKEGESDNADLSGVKVRNADQKSATQIADELAERASQVRANKDPALQRSKQLLGALSPTVLSRLIRTVSFLQYEWNLDLSRVGFPRDPFGSAMLTSVGMFGISEGFAPFTPFAHTPVIVLLGALEERPVVRDGEIVSRPILKVTGTFDHRIIDGFHAGRFSKTFKQIMEDPAAHL